MNNKDFEIIDIRNKIIFSHRKLLLTILTITNTIALIGVPNIKESWIRYEILLRFTFILFVIDTIIVIWYLLMLIKKDLEYTDEMRNALRLGKLQEKYSEIDKKQERNEHYTEIILSVFSLAMVLLIIAIFPKCY